MTWLPLRSICVTNDHVICSVCRNHYPIISSFMTYHPVYSKSNTTGATCGASEFTLGFSGVRIARSLVLYIVVWHFVLFILTIVLSFLLRFTASDYPFVIFKLFLKCQYPKTTKHCKYEKLGFE